ncbi:hypothetical protein ACN083_07335 [Rothia sp. CCM 9418]|uniref:hypothetical protein n=1 Tax=Rothia sp. CCM 9418 TaxID=3402661 RepID=UPI003ADC1559
MNSLRNFTASACVLLVLTIFILPLENHTKLSLIAVLACSALFLFWEVTGRTKAFAWAIIIALTLYLLMSMRYALALFQAGTPTGYLMGAGMIGLPILGGWAMIREILFGIRVEKLEQQLHLNDTSNSYRELLQQLDDGQAQELFNTMEKLIEQEPHSWKNWFVLGRIYEVLKDRKRARKSIRIALALSEGKTPASLEV